MNLAQLLDSKIAADAAGDDIGHSMEHGTAGASAGNIIGSHKEL